MQGYARVSPAASPLALTSNAPNQQANEAKLGARLGAARNVALGK
jgi:hypothetical protein